MWAWRWKGTLWFCAIFWLFAAILLLRVTGLYLPIFAWLQNTYSLTFVAARDLVADTLVWLWFGGIILLGVIHTILMMRISKQCRVPLADVHVVVGDINEQSLLYRLGLRSNDVVTHVDGEPLDDLRPLTEWWDKCTANVTVVRNGRSMNVILKV